MSVALTEKELRKLRSLVPLHTLSEERFGELTTDLHIEHAARGSLLFREGDTTEQHVYLLEGQLALMAGDKHVEQVAAGSDTARFPVAHQLPRRYTAKATVDVGYVRVDSRRLSDLLAHKDKVDYQVDDLDDSANDDWMSQLLHSRVMQQIPAANIQQVMMRVEQIEVGAGEPVIRQGEPGDYFYMLNRGKALVTRDPGDGGEPQELARLGPGSAFGEEALLSDSPRNSTITMLTDGVLLRLSKQDFVELIHHPLSNSCDFDAARLLVDEGAVWLDLRRQEKYEQEHLPGSISIPFDGLRFQTDNLDPGRHYILISDDGSKLASAAFMLTERGFEVSVLTGGYASVVAERVPAADATAAAVQPDDAVEDASATEVDMLRERIKQLEAQRVAAETERQASLHQLKDAIDKARERMEAVEQDRRALAAERDQLRGEGERLSAQLAQAEQQRQALQAELDAREDHEDEWKTRLRKTEAQGIAERDRAESATQQLEEMAKQLQSAREDRELARQANEQESGVLKEALTEVQLELEQLRADYEELRAGAPAEGVDAGDEAARLQAAEQQVVEARKDAEAERLRSAALEAERAELEAAAHAQEAERAQAIGALEQQLEDARAALEDKERALAESAAQTESLTAGLASARGELDELAQRLEQQESAAATEREQREQGQAATAERVQVLEGELAHWQNLAEERAELTRQLEELHAEHSAELARREAAEQTLRDELAAAEQARDAAVASADEARSEASAARVEELQADLADVTGERDAAREEVRELRAVMEQYVEQIRSAQNDGNPDAETLNSELRMVREQAARDLAHLRAELDQALERLREFEAAGNDPLNAEALRQEVASLKDNLAERQRELAEAERNRQQVEDQLEDAAREVERLRRDNVVALSQLSSEDENFSLPPSSRPSRGQVDPADAIDDLVNGGLRDERVKPPRQASTDQVVTGRGSAVVLGLLVGLILVLGGLEVALMLTGRGELFSLLFGSG
jgi:CRP-like cAMP-binding protein